MPMLDVYVPNEALSPEAEATLLDRLTRILVRWEGFDPDDEVMRSVSWAWLHRPATVHVGGVPPEAPRYKVVATVPEGQLDDRAVAGVIAEVTEAVLDAEDGAWPREPGRVWVFPVEVPEGHWGGNGRVTRLADILDRTIGDEDQARLIAGRRIAASRARRAAPPSLPGPGSAQRAGDSATA